jgi:phage tail-like protein
MAKPYAAAHFALELDGGEPVGMFKSIEGGSIKMDVMTYQTGGHFDRFRQLGKPKFEDLKLQVGMAMSQTFYDWIDGFFNKKVVRKTGAILTADFHFDVKARREFSEALIREIGFPQLDSASKQAAYMNVTLAVESMAYKPGQGSLARGGDKLGPPIGFDKQKVWLTNNFRLSLTGLDESLRRVSKIDAFTIKQNITEYHSGGFRTPIKGSSQIEYPNIAFYVPEPDIGPIMEHVTKRGLNGEVPNTDRLIGHITIFDTKDQDVFEIALEGVDIFAITPDKGDAGSEEIKQVKVECYVEKMDFAYMG